MEGVGPGPVRHHPDPVQTPSSLAPQPEACALELPSLRTAYPELIHGVPGSSCGSKEPRCVGI